MGIEKLDDTKILIDTDNKLLNDITLKNVAISITYVIKDHDKFCPQMFFEGALYDK